MNTYRRLLLLLASAAIAAHASAALKLYYTPSEINSGLGQASSNLFTTAVVDAFGGAGNVVEVASFADASAFSDAAALFINPRSQISALSAAELTNILAAINAGKPVFFIGEHSGWETWNNSFLSLFGDSSGYPTGAVNVGVPLDPGSHPLAGSGNLYVSAPGAISGGNGHGIYAKAGNLLPMAAFYGPSDNAVAFLDSNVFSDAAWNWPSNVSLWSGSGAWLYDTALEASLSGALPGVGGLAPVPEPSTYGLIGALALAGVAVARRIRRKAA